MQFDALQVSLKLKCKCNLMDGKLYAKEIFFNIFSMQSEYSMQFLIFKFNVL